MDKQAALKWLEGAASDCMMSLFYYDRKEDEDMPVDKIEQLFESGVISEEDTIRIFTTAIKNAFNGK